MQAAQRRRRPSPSQPFGTGQISLHPSLSPPYWVLPNRVGSASAEAKSATVAATGITQTGSLVVLPKDAAHGFSLRTSAGPHCPAAREAALRQPDARRSTARAGRGAI